MGERQKRKPNFDSTPQKKEKKKKNTHTKKTTMDIHQTLNSIILLYEYNINIMTSICYTGQPNSYKFRSIYQVLLLDAIYPETILWI